MGGHRTILSVILQKGYLYGLFLDSVSTQGHPATGKSNYEIKNEINKLQLYFQSGMANST